MGVRRKGRELALQMLYQWDVTRAPFGEVVWSIGVIRNPSKEARDFGRLLAEGTIRRVEEIDALISAQSDSWRLSRMAAVDRNILRVAVYEFLDTETPKRVIINEALEIAKRFSAPDAVSFVNGVLDAVCATIEATSESK
ncbi:MAG: transcription antitermination factor NusB [Acidobacteria bacterium]|nr:MAG: transcription antitermination factor NusB [Acidobacteriota bacterium]